MRCHGGKVAINLDTLAAAMNRGGSALEDLVRANLTARLDDIPQDFVVDERFFDILAADGPDVDLRYHKWDYREPKPEVLRGPAIA
jgi:hypothetical protein